ncbi:hypothetical protein THIOSC13_1470005 [uncultured Thiomicrorhabdus sp.]
MSGTQTKTKADFMKLFNQIDPSKNRYKIFEDFVTVSAISLHNAVYFSDLSPELVPFS